MKSYLFFWKPSYYPRFRRDYQQWLQKKLKPINWSSGAFKTIPEGSRIFIMRLGEEPKGIVASGWTTSGWRSRRNLHTGDIENTNDLTFDSFADPDHPPVPLSKLLRIKNQTAGLWTAQGTVEMSDLITEKLEAQWARSAARVGSIPRREPKDPNEVPNQRYVEGAVTRIVVNAYERNPAARTACIDHYGATCTVCRFDFVKRYGNIGLGFIHVHHLMEISEIGKRYRIDPINDLRPVCPNCHAMLHSKRPAYSIRELKAMLRR
jgi:5-methylcytosine-specific restriction protein A